MISDLPVEGSEELSNFIRGFKQMVLFIENWSDWHNRIAK